MDRFLALGLTCALIVGASGCGGGNLGGNPAETMKLQVANFNEMADVFGTIKDDATADAAIPKLEKLVSRQNDLKKRLDSYNMSLDDMTKAMKDAGDYVSAGMKMGVASMSASMKAPGKAQAIQAVMNKMEGTGGGGKLGRR